MILTCPECATKYVVKDGAIPPGGRQVRCAACKHSWHQDPEDGHEPAVEANPPAPPPVADPEVDAPLSEAPTEVLPQPVVDEPTPVPVEQSSEAAPATPPEPKVDWRTVDTGQAWAPPEAPSPPAETVAPAEPDDFEPFYDHPAEEAPRRKWPVLLLLLLLAALAAVAFWFLAPAELKQRVGIAEAGSSRLQVMATSNDWQTLASGNDLLTVSGRIINPTDRSLPVPPIRAELLDQSKSRVLYSWVIDPPTATLAANSSASFNSAELGAPREGKFFRVRFTNQGA